MTGPRRSAGMRGDPRQPRPEADISTELPPAAQAAAKTAAPPVSHSRHPKPAVLMGEVMAPRGREIGPGRDAFRAFMQTHRLTPSLWATQSGVPLGEIMGYLTGRSRGFSPETLARLAKAAKVSPDDLFR